MAEIDRVIVTVVLPGSGKYVDMELPAFMQVGRLNEKVEETLVGAFPEQLLDIEGGCLYRNDEILKEKDTLAARGIWDGSILEWKSRGV